MNYALRSNDIREANEKLVLNLIFQNNTISQSQVVQQTGLKAPTVFRIFAKLENAGFIRPCSLENLPDEPIETERKGRRPSYFCVEPGCGYAIGVDFSTSGAAVILVDFRNQVIYRDSTEFSDPPDRDTTLSVIEHIIRRALEETGVAAESVIGIGLAAPGVVDTVNGVVLEYLRIEGLSGFSLRGHFESIFETPVYVHNNASVIASGAYHYGAARDEPSLLAVLVRFGVGAALVNHGQIFLNGTNTALEVGRTSTCAASAEDVAGDRSTLEMMIAEQPLLTRLKETFPVADWLEADRELTVAQASAALTRERLTFGMSVRNLYHVFHPDAILLISRYRLLSEFLAESVRAALPERRVIAMVYDPVQACYGATDLVFQQFFRPTPGTEPAALGAGPGPARFS
ncbi:MAG: ROK family transcriptional regulator [Spirochaetaceae bacterium]|nr:MAG: ROK family transcriptional regulator [Spirochaetaceae bacterium]